MLIRERLPARGSIEGQSRPTPFHFDSQGSARVQAVRGGPAEFRWADHGWQDLVVGKVLGSGSVVRTGPRSTVDLWFLQSGSLVRLTPRTSLALDALGYGLLNRVVIPQTVLRVEEGQVQLGLKQQPAGAIFEIRTRRALYRARIAQLVLRSDGTVRVEEGSVQAYQGEKVTEIQAGQVFVPEQ